MIRRHAINCLLFAAATILMMVPGTASACRPSTAPILFFRTAGIHTAVHTAGVAATPRMCARGNGCAHATAPTPLRATPPSSATTPLDGRHNALAVRRDDNSARRLPVPLVTERSLGDGCDRSGRGLVAGLAIDADAPAAFFNDANAPPAPTLPVGRRA